MEKEKFEKIVRQAIKSIPKKFLERLENVEILIEDEPNPHQLRKLKAKRNFLVLGLYEGIPKTKRWNYQGVLPDKITIFKNPIEKIASSEKEIKEIVKNTIWHEIAHHFGIDEKKIREIERRKKKSG